MFRRRRRAADDAELDELEGVDDGTDADAAAGEEPAAVPADQGRPQGPWDADDVPDDEVARLDLGGLQVPVPEGVEVRVDMQEEHVVAATLVDGHSALQVHAFAAPRSSGIWDEVRQEIAQSLRQAGGSAEDTDGPFGTELRARIPGEAAGGGPQLQPARFWGVDGPRWFLRGLLSGPAATDPVQGRRLEGAFRGIVVVRGGEAMAPRDALPLRLPREAMQAVQAEQEAASAAQQAERPSLELPERGPEITETR